MCCFLCLYLYKGMFSRNNLTSAELFSTIFAVCITGISVCAGCFHCATDLCMLVIGRIHTTICHTTHFTDCLLCTGCFSTAVCRLVNDIATANSLALFPVICLIRRPHICRIMCFLLDDGTFLNQCITGSAILIACITFLIAGGFLLIFHISTAYMIVRIHSSILKSLGSLLTAYCTAFIIDCL